jgi:hypothetical protein
MQSVRCKGGGEGQFLHLVKCFCDNYDKRLPERWVWGYFFKIMISTQSFMEQKRFGKRGKTNMLIQASDSVK